MTKTWWTMEDLVNETGRSRPWVVKNILEIPKYKSIIQEFGHYPATNNDHYAFIGSKMKQFLEERFQEIYHFKEVSKWKVIAGH